MRVFISWSGERSRAIAEVLRDWLPQVIQAVRPYFSPDDITKGTRWDGEIARALKESKLGIICLTSDNLNAPWIMFEAGAISKSMENSKVCPLLFGVGRSEVVGPLLSFQAATFDAKEMRRVLNMVNIELEEEALSKDVLDSSFEIWWPRLERQISSELEKTNVASVDRRTDREILEEVLERTRVGANLEKEFKGRLLSGLGYVVGEMSSQPGLLEPLDRDRLIEAVRHCQQGYDYLKEVGGSSEFLGLNNLIYYSTALNDVSRRDFLLEQSRRLIDAGQQHKATNLILTGCRAILQFSSDPEEKKGVRKRLTALLQDSISDKERKEAQLYLDTFPDPPGA